MLDTWRACLVALSVVLGTACGGGEGGGGERGGGDLISGPDPGSQPTTSGGELTDAQVSMLSRAPSGWTYYRNRPDTLSRSSGSGHSESHLRTRYNEVAAAQLGADGKVHGNAVFADSSLIVKELIAEGTLNRYAVMMKMRASDNAGDGWLWAYYRPDGSTLISITSRGAACTGCHSTGIDYTRMNDSYP